MKIISHCNLNLWYWFAFFFLFCYVAVFFHGHWPFAGQQGKRRYHPHFSLSVLSNFEYQVINLHFYIWDAYTTFLIVTHVISRLFLDEIHPALGINTWLNVNCVKFVDVIMDVVNFFLRNCGFEFTSTISLFLQTYGLINHMYCNTLVY